MRGLLRRGPLFLEAVERSCRLMRQLLGVSERFLDDRLNHSVAAAAIGAASEATINCTRRARALFAAERIPDFHVGNGVAGTDDHVGFAIPC